MALLMLLRHAKSAWPDAVADLERPLAPRGERDAQTVGRFLAARELRPELTLSSPALRARRTAEAVLHAAGSDPAAVQIHDQLYDGDVAAVLRQVPADVNRVLVVGHEPELLDLAQRLCGAEVALPTAALALIELQAPWSQLPTCRGVLKVLVTPKLLAAAKWTTV
ncbi:MAG: SixA phosphatase family protein [Acidimicrobiales bacterium]